MSGEYVVHEEQYKGHTIKIEIDLYPLNPREEWDNLGIMQTWHRRYYAPKEAKNRFVKNEQYFDLENPREFQEWLKTAEVISLPIFAYDHSCFVLSTRIEQGWHHANWDSGQYGWIFVPKDQVRKDYGWKYITANRRKKIESYLKNEIEILSNFFNGQVYGYIVEDESGEHLDSCCGFYGDYDYALQEAKSIIDDLVKDQQEKEWAKVV